MQKSILNKCAEKLKRYKVYTFKLEFTLFLERWFFDTFSVHLCATLGLTWISIVWAFTKKKSEIFEHDIVHESILALNKKLV